ncbi:MAG: thiol reductant ABC exporter subunit CydD [Actinomycetota bacterium]|nr:thiol reductant ABC exporter subunit CydD [Actinomycetota bacterium]
MKPLDPRLLRYARATQTHLVVSVVLGLLTAALVIVQAELLSRGIARVVSDGADRSALSAVFIGLAAVVAGRAVIAWFQDSAAQRSSALVKSQLRRQVVARATTLGPDATASRADVATLATRGIDALDGYFGLYLPQLVLAVVVPIAVLLRLFTADLTATITVAVTLPLIPVFMVLVGKATEASNAKRWDALVRLSHHFLDVVAGMQTLKVFGRAKAQADLVRRTTDRYRTTTMATLRVAFLSSLVLELIATLAVALVAVGVGLRLVDGGIDLRTGLLVIILAPEAYLPLRQVGARYHAAADGLAAAEQAFTILEAPLPTMGAVADIPDLRRGGALRIAGVSVAHPGRVGFAPAPTDLSAALGEIVLLVGPSGAGKTTLLSVLLGARAPDSGSVTIVGDGRELLLADADLTAWRTQLAWVDQTPYLFAGTIADNVRLARPDADDAEVRRALDACGLAAAAADTPVGEAGQALSSGERRRVAMARATLRGAPVLLLDEPTAGLDSETERELLATVSALAVTSIVIMVSHRPAAIAIADRIVEVAASEAATSSAAAR